MTSLQSTTSPNKLAGLRFLSRVRRMLLRAFQEQNTRNNLSQADIARIIGTNRSTINRELLGAKDFSVTRAEELARAMGMKFKIELVDIEAAAKPKVELLILPMGEIRVIQGGRDPSREATQVETPKENYDFVAVGE